MPTETLAARSDPGASNSVPTVTGVTASGAGLVDGAGDLGIGRTVTLTVATSGAVSVTGTPTLALSDGGTAAYVAEASTSTALAFTYTVATGDASSPDLALAGGASSHPGAIGLPNGATIVGPGGAADLSGADGANPAGLLRIDTVVPTITGIATSGTGIADGDGDLGIGATVTLTVATSEAVLVTGTPLLTLNDGGSARYTGGSGSGALRFVTTVAAGQSTPDLAVSGIALSGGTIASLTGNAASLVGASRANPAGILQIDASVPGVTSVVASGANISGGSGGVGLGAVVTLTLYTSQTVTVAGTSVLSLNDGGTATYSGGSGSTALAFVTTVGAGDTSVAALGVTGVGLPAGAAITSLVGNAADLSCASAPAAGIVRVDTVVPAVASVAVSGTGVDGGGNGLLGVGQTVTLTLGTSEAVTVVGTPVLALDDGGTATYTGGSGSNALTFSHVVSAGDTSTGDLMVARITLPSGASITGRGGNAAALGGATANPSGTLAIDTTVPAVTGVAASGAGISGGSGTLGVGAVVTLTLDTSEAVVVSGGAPVLTLNDGGTARYVSGSGSAALVFAGTVAAGEATADLTVTGITLPAGTTITNAAGNAAELGGAAANPAGTLVVETAPAAGVITVTGAAGATVVLTPAAGSNLVSAPASGDVVVDSRGDDTINAGGGSDLVYASGAAATVNGGAGNLVFVAGAGSYVAGGGGGTDILYGGPGSSTLSGGAGANSILVAGSGNTSLLGSAGSAAVMYGGTGSTSFAGSAGGNDTMVGGAGPNSFAMTSGDVAYGGPTGPDVFDAGRGASLIVEGPGATRVDLGGGALTVFGGRGADTYVVTQGVGGTASIIGFKAGDRITLVGGFSAAQAVAAVAGEAIGSFGTVLRLVDGTTINVFGVTVMAGQVSAG